MRHFFLPGLCLMGAFALSACTDQTARVQKAVQSVKASDEQSLNEIMLTVADPREAVAYFQKGAAAKPNDMSMLRGLAKSLVRAQEPEQGAEVWAHIVSMPGATNEDRVAQADALIRANKWKKAEQVLNAINPTYETFDRYRLEAMVADSRKQWKKADSFYATAAGMTTQPAGIYNNWGFSKLTRGDYAGAEKLFYKALSYDPNLFTAKNNLVLARGAQRKYDLPVIPMTQVERAKLLYTLALTAVKQGDVATGKSLLKDAIDTNPRYFPDAQRALDALENNPNG
ncbi:hypothetical protein U879_01300 [Defluviimonas sp. 20V17]|uniref:Flp pilus assembly protein TadD, contains TPR repeats n=1 Tax=Allgaiera indica TaxID=765699 RepID=A0AAN4UU59_9RHOB|nr:hypothetical protein [Allgaiera indica]KDB05451.1 hypothetical protein U879_01300 [Defluviimonas sp. 20V17]GHE04697.1 hypothetical protein GCM10008024_32780 [Allgaiera indica]SDX47101.1 Flp pilus assembly protein TadD, contains TPR repeats [Allgaiera indica]